MTETTLRASLFRHCKQVFATMLDIDISEVPAAREAPASDNSEQIVSLIGFSGNYTGNCMVSCSKPFACRLASIMLMEEYREVNGEVMDAFGEISNMIFGNVKADLEEHLGPLQLSIPTVIAGREFNVRSLANPSWISIPLKAGSDAFEARMCVLQNPGRPSSQKTI